MFPSRLQECSATLAQALSMMEGLHHNLRVMPSLNCPVVERIIPIPGTTSSSYMVATKVGEEPTDVVTTGWCQHFCIPFHL